MKFQRPANLHAASEPHLDDGAEQLGFPLHLRYYEASEDSTELPQQPSEHPLSRWDREELLALLELSRGDVQKRQGLTTSEIEAELDAIEELMNDGESELMAELANLRRLRRAATKSPELANSSHWLMADAESDLPTPSDQYSEQELAVNFEHNELLDRDFAASGHSRGRVGSAPLSRRSRSLIRATDSPTPSEAAVERVEKLLAAGVRRKLASRGPRARPPISPLAPASTASDDRSSIIEPLTPPRTQPVAPVNRRVPIQFLTGELRRPGPSSFSRILPPDAGQNTESLLRQAGLLSNRPEDFNSASSTPSSVRSLSSCRAERITVDRPPVLPSYSTTPQQQPVPPSLKQRIITDSELRDWTNRVSGRAQADQEPVKSSTMTVPQGTIWDLEQLARQAKSELISSTERAKAMLESAAQATKIRQEFSEPNGHKATQTKRSPETKSSMTKAESSSASAAAKQLKDEQPPSGSQRQRIRVTIDVGRLRAKPLSATLDADTHVEDLLSKVSRATGLDSQCLRLKFGNRQLNRGRTLRHYELSDACVLRLCADQLVKCTVLHRNSFLPVTMPRNATVRTLRMKLHGTDRASKTATLTSCALPWVTDCLMTLGNSSDSAWAKTTSYKRPDQATLICEFASATKFGAVRRTRPADRHAEVSRSPSRWPTALRPNPDAARPRVVRQSPARRLLGDINQQPGGGRAGPAGGADRRQTQLRVCRAPASRPDNE
ncbi:hypothetical protein BOX15_Mlig032073g5 [Macrostomum lignano]|uniref:Ubiquitin-like domain-containing protein n=1 Tax=Macrostomum lignano TaxID=282301 RepID=A0A267DB99_9PLAT|nr:hypothetical protein BOX15_Mlig032073g5 [Macrostomum lignano]